MFDLGGIEVRGLQHRIDGGIDVRGTGTAGGAELACGSERSLLRGLLDGGVDVEDASELDYAEQQHKRQGKDDGGLEDFLGFGAPEFQRELFDCQQKVDPSLAVEFHTLARRQRTR